MECLHMCWTLVIPESHARPYYNVNHLQFDIAHTHAKCEYVCHWFLRIDFFQGTSNSSRKIPNN